jgi:hypothetical protein
LAIALALAVAIGLEREVRQKSAGLRTHTLVGGAAALIMLVSKYGFGDMLGVHVVLDPSRIAAQIVSGIGFIGGGLIFVRRDAVRGLTTAATIWLTAGVGMAAGAGLWLLAVLVTGVHFLVVLAFTPLAARLPRSKYALTRLRLSYLDGQGVLRQALGGCRSRPGVHALAAGPAFGWMGFRRGRGGVRGRGRRRRGRLGGLRLRGMVLSGLLAAVVAALLICIVVVMMAQFGPERWVPGWCPMR